MKITQTSQFKKDIKRQQKRGKDTGKLKEVIGLLLAGANLPVRYRNHPLAGPWKGRWDCHIEPDWVLIYRLSSEELRLERTGTHSDLF